MTKLLHDVIMGNAYQGWNDEIEHIRRIMTKVRIPMGNTKTSNDFWNAYAAAQQKILEEAIAHRRDYAMMAFCIQHEITEEELADDHWQTLFALTYPEVVS